MSSIGGLQTVPLPEPIDFFDSLVEQAQLILPPREGLREDLLAEPNRGQEIASQTQTLDQSGTFSANGGSARFILGTFQPVLPLPRPRPTRERFNAMQKWEGFVIEVKDDTFFARLTPIIGEGPDQEAEIYLSEVEPERPARSVAMLDELRRRRVRFLGGDERDAGPAASAGDVGEGGAVVHAGVTDVDEALDLGNGPGGGQRPGGTQELDDDAGIGGIALAGCGALRYGGLLPHVVERRQALVDGRQVAVDDEIAQELGDGCAAVDSHAITPFVDAFDAVDAVDAVIALRGAVQSAPGVRSGFAV